MLRLVQPTADEDLTLGLGNTDPGYRYRKRGKLTAGGARVVGPVDHQVQVDQGAVGQVIWTASDYQERRELWNRKKKCWGKKCFDKFILQNCSSVVKGLNQSDTIARILKQLMQLTL